MQLSFASLALVLAASGMGSGVSAQVSISKPAPGFVQAAAGPTYSKDEPRFAPSSTPNAQPTGGASNNNNNAAVTPSSAASPLGAPGPLVAGAGVAGVLAALFI